LSGWGDVDYADELFFEGFDVADEDFWFSATRMERERSAPWALTLVVKAFSETC
jgi:hypothetical protein